MTTTNIQQDSLGHSRSLWNLLLVLTDYGLPDARGLWSASGYCVQGLLLDNIIRSNNHQVTNKALKISKEPDRREILNSYNDNFNTNIRDRQPKTIYTDCTVSIATGISDSPRHWMLRSHTDQRSLY
ncbi:hypothetical protein HZ326_14939 [Fusarium oxysporum f. sp. albedinis]|nr:hypothetical protein HZ326_14939 [Fusarium oxysporum f. sp. albedinis]